MKPDEEMHAAVEEVDLDPCDLFVDLGTLIVEGRVPGLTDRGFGEGPHCLPSHGQNRHQCNPSSPDCQKYEQVQKHMLLLWKNGIPMSIEVLLYPSCCTPSQNVDAIPEISCILLEQWTIHMLPKRVPDASISSRGLIQAVRSSLYFSQLCAWLSLTGGKSPRNVYYRVCVPGEAFSSKFSTQPDCHIFPIANVGRNAAMKVLVKCHPRCGEIPTVPCLKHSQANLPLKTLKCLPEPHKDKEFEATGEYVYDGILPPGRSSRTSSPADSMLGESLLDPPNSLCMYPKRYQSPSRCGSPSIEVPEHLMFGKSSLKKSDTSLTRRSRPQRRPVVERFLKKTLGDDSGALSISDIKSHSFDKRCAIVNEPLKTRDKLSTLKGEETLDYYCINDGMNILPKEEMEQVLEQLRERHSGGKCPYRDIQAVHHSSDKNSFKLCNIPLSNYFEEMKINPENLENKSLNQTSDTKNHFKQVLRLNKQSSKNWNSAEQTSKLKSSIFQLTSMPEVHTSKQSTTDSKFKVKNESNNQHLQTNASILQFSRYSERKKNEANLIHSLREKPFSAIQNTSEPIDYNTYHQETENSLKFFPVISKLSNVNIKKYGDLLSSRETSNELCDEREIQNTDYTHEASFDNLDDAVFSAHIIPSAEKKALFRRSLDSATSLVFHQRSGLPLTSSPAPIRKSGTCFDFDSSLTSVSAIKRALFEKVCEDNILVKEKELQLNYNLPASNISSSLLGTFEESVLNGRLEPVSTVEGFTAEIGASGSFCPRHITLPVTVFFYTLQDMDKVTSPYMGHINLRDKDYHIPKKGTVQVTLFNPHNTVVKMFVVRYDLSDMPINCQTFLRQRTLYMPSDASEDDPDAQKWLRYLIHLRFMSSKSGRIYLHTDIRVIIFRKSDLDAATVHGQRPYELRSFTHGPLNPKFSPHKP